MAQQFGPFRIFAGEGVVALPVGHRDVEVHAAAGGFGERLGHEGRFHAVGHRDALDQPLVHDRIVGRAQCIGLVAQGEFELPGGIFGNPAFQRQPLFVAGGVEIVEERLEVFHLAQAIDLDVARAVPGDHPARRHRPPVFQIAEIEFELDRDHRGQPQLAQAVDHLAQHVARVEIVGRAVQLVKAGQELGVVLTQPRRADQRAGDRIDIAVGIAVFPDQPGLLAIAPGNVDHQHRSGQEPPALIDRLHLVLAQPLAARDAADVGEDDVDRIDFGIGREEILGLLKQGAAVRGLGRLGHDGHPIRVWRQSSRTLARRSTWALVVAGLTRVMLWNGAISTPRLIR